MNLSPASEVVNRAYRVTKQQLAQTDARPLSTDSLRTVFQQLLWEERDSGDTRPESVEQILVGMHQALRERSQMIAA